MSLNFCNVFFTSLKCIMTGKATVPQAEKTSHDSACIKIFGGNIHMYATLLLPSYKNIVDMCIYITCLAQPSCFLRLIFHMNSMQMQVLGKVQATPHLKMLKCYIMLTKPLTWTGTSD
jgi:hypothetical protein